jgi:flagellar hook-associated protein 2
MGVSLTGLASGLDTSTLITQLMNLEKVPYTNLESKKTAISNNKTIFNNINLKLKTLRDAATALSDLGAFNVSSATSSDSTKLTATGGENAINGSYSVKVIQLAKQQVNATAGMQVTDANGEDIEFTSAALAEAKSIKIGGQSITLNDDDFTGKTYSEALSLIASQINKQFGDVQASVVQRSEGVKSLVITAKETGKTVDISGTGSFKMWEKVAAQPAILEVNNLSVTSTSNTVANAIPGVTLQLLAENSTVNVEVKQDTDKLASKVDDFVKAYNDVVKLIRENTKKIENTKGSDGSYTNFKTNLQGDSTLRDLQSELYDIVNSVVGSSDNLKLLSDIGLEIDKGVTSASLMTGELSFDKDKFKKKLAENPEAVAELFQGENGLGTLAKDRLYGWTSTNGLIAMRIQGLQSDIDFITDQMESMNERLKLKEEALNKQFSQLEVALSNLQNQQSWLAGQLNSLMSSSY